MDGQCMKTSTFWIMLEVLPDAHCIICCKIYHNISYAIICKIRPHRRCKGRDHPDGISMHKSTKVQDGSGLPGGGCIFWKKPPVFDRS